MNPQRRHQPFATPSRWHFLLLVFTCILGNLTSTLAQNLPLPPDLDLRRPPRRGAASEPAGEQAPPPQSPPRNNSDGYELQFPNNPVEDILDYYETLTEKQLIKDANLTGVNLSLETSRPLTKTEAIQAIEALLLINGYAIVPSGDNALKIINTQGKQPGGQGLPVYSTLDELPEEDRIVNFVMSLAYIKPDDAQRVFTQITRSSNPYASITAIPNASAVVITDNVSVIRSLLKIKESIDVPPTQVSNKFFKLERADAERVAEILEELLKTNSRSSGSVSTASRNIATANNPINASDAAAARLAARNRARSASEPVATDDNYEIKIVPDTRTNRILVIARPVDLLYIEGLIAGFDIPSDIQNFLKIELEYVTANTLLPIISDSLTRGSDEETASGGGVGTQPTFTNQQSAFTSGGGGGSDSLSRPDRLQDPAEAQLEPESLVVGKTLVIADPGSNAIIVSGPPEDLQLVEELVDEIDQRPRMVYLSAVVGQLTLGDGIEYGLDILRTLEEFEGSVDSAAGLYRTRGATDPSQTIFDIKELGDIANFPITQGIGLYGLIGDNFNVFINALESVSKFKVVSRPTVYTRNNRKAVISSGQRIPVPSQSLTSLDNGEIQNPSVSSTIEFRDVVLKLEVVPLINNENEVTLRIAQLKEDIVDTVNISGNPIPIIGAQELLTEVTVPNRSTIVLGGLITESDQQTNTGLPFISRIPILRSIFGSTKKDSGREELLIFIQPTIVTNAQDLLEANIDETRRQEISLDAYKLGEAPVQGSEVKPKKEKKKWRWFRSRKKRREDGGYELAD